VHIRLKGINSRRKQLADGTWKTYWYAWKGGPRLDGKPGSPEFIASYNVAVSAKIVVSGANLKFVISRFEDSAEFGILAPRTKSDYLKHLDAIETEFGTFPLSGLKNRRARVIFSEWRDRLAKNSLRQADYAWSVFARCLSWALKRGLVDANPLERGGVLYKGSRAEKVWSEIDEAKLMAVASPQIALAFMLALWTGQRQGDLLRLTWSAYDGTRINLKQRKRGARVSVPVGAPLKAMLDAQDRKSPVILLQRDDKPWSEDGFRSSWKKACVKAGIVGLTFHDLRGTAVTRLAKAGCSVPEIATFTGHSLNDVNSILDANYLSRDPELSDNAIRKLEKRTKIPD
jgi:integrase